MEENYGELTPGFEKADIFLERLEVSKEDSTETRIVEVSEEDSTETRVAKVSEEDSTETRVVDVSNEDSSTCTEPMVVEINKKHSTETRFVEDDKEDEDISETREYAGTPEPTTFVDYNFSSSLSPFLLAESSQPFGSNNLRGCKWSSDGSRLMVNCDDYTVRVYDLPLEKPSESCNQSHHIEWTPVSHVKEGGLVYDMAWYPKNEEQLSHCFVTTSKDSPVHLRNGLTGELIASYQSHSPVDELMSAHSLAFDDSGERLFCGFNKSIRIFDLNMPGRYSTIRQLHKRKSSTNIQAGIISCIAFNPAMASIYAAGSYLRTVGLYDDKSGGALLCILEGHKGGVTHVSFSHDGTLLFSGARKDNEIVCWDLRNPGKILYTLTREVDTNQRIYFDCSGNYIVSGNTDGYVTAWNMYDEVQPPVTADYEALLQPVFHQKLHNDCVNGVSLHRHLPVLATTSGQCHFPELTEDDTDNIWKTTASQNSLRLWWIGYK